MKIDRSTKTAEEILREETRDLRKFRPHEIYIIAVIAVVWVIFQLSLASFLVLESAKVRTIHLAFGLALSFLTIPCIRRPTK